METHLAWEKYTDNNTLSGMDEYTEYNWRNILSVIILKPLH